MMHTLQSCGQQQHINQPTHHHGHTLDVLITRDTSASIGNVDVEDIGLCDDKGTLLQSHFAVTCDILLPAVSTKLKAVSYRQLKNIDTEQFKIDISSSDTLNNATGSADEILERYSLGLTTLLNRHAPLIHRTITLRPNTSWYTETLRDAKRCRRKKERKWRRTNSEADRIQYRQ